MRLSLLLLRHRSINQRRVRDSTISGLRVHSHAELVPPPTEIPGLESSVIRISQIMTSMTASHEQNTSSLSTLSVELVRLDERETELRDIVTRTEEKRSWFADFREWLESVATFLDEKVQSWHSLAFLTV
jgi:Nineteen complex-related protein 2